MRLHTFKALMLCICIIAGLVLPVTQIHAQANLSVESNHAVSVYYCLSSDYQFDQDEFDAVMEAVIDVQAWYQIATGGMTFQIENGGIPFVVNLPNSSVFYNQNEGLNIHTLISIDLVNIGFNMAEPGSLKIFFVKGGRGMAVGGQGCNGDCGSAMIGMDIFPEFNTGIYFDCPGGVGGEAWPCTPRGATAHELGHAFGLPHSFDNYGLDISLHSVMHAHWLYPYYYAEPGEGDPWSLLTEERQHLWENPFFELDIVTIQPYEEMPLQNLPDQGPLPTADFTFEVDNLEVMFSNTSTGADLYYWTFGNGDVSTDENPTHTFPAYGVYTVRLRASGSNGMMDMAEVTVGVCNINSNISSSTTVVCAGEVVTIQASGGTSYEWSTGENAQSISPEVFETSVFTVSISDPSGCSVEESITIEALPAPELILTADQEEICTGEGTVLEAFGGDEFLWSTGEIASIIEVSPTETSVFDVQTSNEFGCFSTESIQITVFPIPQATIIASDSTLCQGDTVVLAAMGGSQYLWNNGATVFQIISSPDTNVTYSVTAYNSAGCSDQAVLAISVNPSPVATLISSDSIVCSGDSVIFIAGGGESYLWSTGDSVAQIAQSILQSTAIAVTVSNSQGCTDIVTGTLEVYALPNTEISASSDTVCFGESVSLTGPVADAYLWTTGDTTAMITYQYLDSTVVGLTIWDSNECTYYSEASVIVNPGLEFEVSGSNFLCFGDTVVLSITPAFPAYMWSSGCATQECSITEAGLVMVTVTDSLGCINTQVFDIAADNTYGVQITGDTAFCVGTEVHLALPNGYTSYSWSTGEVSAAISISSAGLYIATVTDGNGCQSSTQIEVSELSLPVFQLEFDGELLSVEGLSPAKPYAYQWNDGSTAATLFVSVSGNYCVTVTDAQGCSSEACIELTVSAVSQPETRDFLIYPNPFSDLIIIESGYPVNATFTLSDMLHQTVLMQEQREEKKWELNLTHLPSGVYVLLIETTSGVRKITKIVKQ